MRYRDAATPAVPAVPAVPAMPAVHAVPAVPVGYLRLDSLAGCVEYLGLDMLQGVSSDRHPTGPWPISRDTVCEFKRCCL
jgi:hypothetical protein